MPQDNDPIKLQTLELLKKYQSCKDPNYKRRLGDRLTQLNIGLVQKVANQVVKGFNHGVDVDDLIQEGCKGLIKSFDNFDVASGNAFSSFAVPKIRGEMQHYVRDRSDLIRIPRRWENAKGPIRRFRQAGWSSKAIADHLKWTLDELAQAERAFQRVPWTDIQSDRMIELSETDTDRFTSSYACTSSYEDTFIEGLTTMPLDQKTIDKLLSIPRENGMFDATYTCRTFEKQFKVYWKRRRTKQFLIQLESRVKDKGTEWNLYSVSRGRCGRAWVNKELLLDILKWCDRTIELEMNRMLLEAIFNRND